MKTMKSFLITVCVLVFLEESQSQLSYNSHRMGRNQIPVAEPLPAPHKIMQHRKRFMKVPERRLGSARERLVGKALWENDYRQFSEDRDSY